MTDDPRIDSLRWIATHNGTPGRPSAHLWLGDHTACGITRPGQPTISSRRCVQCTAYARGWLDRNDWVRGRWPSPLGDGPQPISPARAAANRAVLERALHRSG